MAKEDKKLMLSENDCIGCGICVTICPTNMRQEKDINFDVDSEPRAITIHKGRAVIDYDLCKACGICTKNCPLNSLTIEVVA
jgi:4Fe-4S ferredoxin